jgi:AcrR family transcriptional regulator
MAGARTEEIAADARTNKAMLYYYFGDKRRLHRAVLKNLFRQLRQGVYGTPEKSSSPRERLFAIVAAYFKFLATHPNYPRLVQREAMESGSNFTWIAREYLRPFHARLVRTIEQGIAVREIRRVDPRHTAFTIMGMTTSFFAAAPIYSEIARRNLLAPREVAARKKALLDFLDHALTSCKGAAAS